MTYPKVIQALRITSAMLIGIAALLAILIWLGVSQFGASDQAVSVIKSSSAIYFLIGFLCLSVFLTLITPIAIPRLVFLLGLFPLLVGWRISALTGMGTVNVLCACAFAGFVAMFITLVLHGLRTSAPTGRPQTKYSTVQLAFIRLYIGLDLIPHCTEKLFAGPTVRSGDVQSFQALGVPDPLQFVLVAGMIEFSAAIGVGLGLFTRLAAVLTVVYLMVATIMGHHFLLGFIWASPGGGWEYPVLWSVLILSFVFGGGRWMSLDEVISEHVKLPRWVLAPMGDTSSHCHTRMDSAES
ncbi:DoxX family protein [Ruegeria sp. ANG-S4]|uniref:DoxX family protein n=1 Tax=Ruegeria sp. ANG-S4 TaxID=1577904 RepID=UPI00126A0424|nr:DoxX family protein [Ruegeria sp. ANG-S4]